MEDFNLRKKFKIASKMFIEKFHIHWRALWNKKRVTLKPLKTEQDYLQMDLSCVHWRTSEFVLCQLQPRWTLVKMALKRVVHHNRCSEGYQICWFPAGIRGYSSPTVKTVSPVYKKYFWFTAKELMLVMPNTKKVI